MTDVHPRNPDRRRLLWLTEDDIVAAQRILTALQDNPEGGSATCAASEARPAARSKLLERGRISLSLRQWRIAKLGPMFSAEPPFVLLVALYATEATDPLPTITKLTRLAWLTQSTALRWIEPLAREGWISRTVVAPDKRKAQIRLTSKARKTLDEIFGWPD